MTADIGMGANMGIESATVLANVLQSSFSKNPKNYHPSIAELTSLFSKYQAERYERAKRFTTVSGSVTRMRSYQSLWKRFFIGYIATLPFMQRLQSAKMMEGMAKGPKLQYVGTRTINEDTEGWNSATKKQKQGIQGSWVVYALLTSCAGMAISYAVVLKWGLPL
jgi:FAD dependent monooxygenase